MPLYTITSLMSTFLIYCKVLYKPNAAYLKQVEGLHKSLVGGVMFQDSLLHYPMPPPTTIMFSSRYYLHTVHNA